MRGAYSFLLLTISSESRAMAVTTVLGTLLILFGIGFAVAALFRKASAFKNPTTVVLPAFFIGAALLFSNRITELTIPAIGTIKAATVRATTDAATINALKKRVEDQSATVDAVAAQAEKAQKLSQAAEQQVTALKKVSSEGAATIAKLKSDEHFIWTITKAQNDDRQAYDELQKIARDQNNRLHTLAGNAWVTIYNGRSQSFFENPAPLRWPKGIHPASLSFEKLKQIYKTVPHFLKPAYLAYLFQRKDILKLQKMDFFLHVMKTATGLNTMEYAGRYFEQDAGLTNIKAMALPYLVHWWSLHRKDFAGKTGIGKAEANPKNKRPPK